MKMSKYSMEVKQQALAMVAAEGVNKTSEVMHITKLTLYRWRNETNADVSVELDGTKKRDTQSSTTSEKSTKAPVDNVTAKPIISSLDEPTNKPIRKKAFETAKQLLLEESNEKAARIRFLEAENAQLRSEAEQLHNRCERYRDTLIALIR
jgi:transposase-like protein